MIMQAIDLLADEPDPDDETVRKGLEGNLCRCTGYQNIVRAVQDAAQRMKPGAGPKIEQHSDETVAAKQPVGGE
jgi:carbon-monoxide dehydrogenase small subunit